MKLGFFVAGLLAFCVAVFLDYRSSLGLYEANPVFRRKDGRVSGVRMIVYVAAVVALAAWLYRNDFEVFHTVSLFLGAVIHFFVSRRNRKLQERQKV